MKRSPLRRKTQLKPISKRTAKLKRETSPARHAYVAEIGVCVCGQQATECHEIAAGSSRQKALRNRFAWLALCSKCHERVQSTDMAEQYSRKALQDPEHYDRVGLNVLRGRVADAVSEVDVIHGLKRLLERGEL